MECSSGTKLFLPVVSSKALPTLTRIEFIFGFINIDRIFRSIYSLTYEEKA